MRGRVDMMQRRLAHIPSRWNLCRPSAIELWFAGDSLKYLCLPLAQTSADAQLQLWDLSAEYHHGWGTN